MANRAGKLNVELPRPDTWRSRLIRRRALAVSLVGLVLVLVDVVDHYDPSSPTLLGLEFWFRLPIYGFLIPSLAWKILSWSAHLERERDQVVQGIDQKSEFSHRLTQASNDQELVHEILQFTASIIPEAKASLYIFDNESGRFFPAMEWCITKECADSVHSILSPNQCLRCITPGMRAAFALPPCWLLPPESYPDHSQLYCLPLTADQQVIALLQIEVSGGQTITNHQVRLLTNALPEIALAIKNTQLSHIAVEQSKARASERQHIAWELHDTLGQDITFLRMKLEQFKANGSLQSIAAIQMDLTRMLEIANQAYEQVSFTLKGLYQDREEEWLTTLQAHGQFIASQSGMQFHIVVKGQPIVLAPEVILQVYYICREALNNIQEHAKAKQARLCVIWEERALEIRIGDDGRGFNLDTASANGSFGLKIMQERARFLGGNLEVHSVPDQGTEIVLRLPDIHAYPKHWHSDQIYKADPMRIG